MIRKIEADEVEWLRPFLDQLAAYHNAVSLHHKGFYPARDMDTVIQNFHESIQRGMGAVAVADENGTWQGFVSVEAGHGEGALGFLFVKETVRGKGLGRALMDWAMDWLKERGCQKISVKVIAGNPAIHLYESYGFQLNAHILWKVMEIGGRNR